MERLLRGDDDRLGDAQLRVRVFAGKLRRREGRGNVEAGMGGRWTTGRLKERVPFRMAPRVVRCPDATAVRYALRMERLLLAAVLVPQRLFPACTGESER